MFKNQIVRNHKEYAMKIGPLELVVIFIVALLVIGPNKLPEYAKKLGSAMKEFKKASESITNEIKENVVQPLDEMQKPLRDAVAPITEMDKEIRSTVKDVTDSVNSIGKPKKDAPKQEAPSTPEVTEAPAEAEAQSEAAE